MVAAPLENVGNALRIDDAGQNGHRADKNAMNIKCLMQNAKWENTQTESATIFELQFLCSAAPASLYLTFVVAVAVAVVVVVVLPLLLLLLAMVVVCGQPSNHTFLALSVQNNLSISPIQQHRHHHPTPSSCSRCCCCQSTKRDGNCCCSNCSSDGSGSPGRMSGNIYHLHAHTHTH